LAFVAPWSIYFHYSFPRCDLFLALYLYRSSRVARITWHGDVLSPAQFANDPALTSDFTLFVASSCWLRHCWLGPVGCNCVGSSRPAFRPHRPRDRITNLFGQPRFAQVVERLMAKGASTASDIRRVAVMFVDSAAFTAAARSRSPQESSIVWMVRSRC